MSKRQIRREISQKEYGALYKIQFGWSPIGWRFTLYGEKETIYKISLKKILCNIDVNEFVDLYIWLLMNEKKKWIYLDNKYIRA